MSGSYILIKYRTIFNEN